MKLDELLGVDIVGQKWAGIAIAPLLILNGILYDYDNY